jgi:hypothetical protein
VAVGADQYEYEDEVDDVLTDAERALLELDTSERPPL